MTTTVLSDDTATIVSDETANRFNWGAVFAGAAVAIATAFFLTILGAGFGLTLMPRGGSATFLTLGAIWVLASQAFGFAAGGHVTGRLIGQAVETKKEEEIAAELTEKEQREATLKRMIDAQIEREEKAEAALKEIEAGEKTESYSIEDKTNPMNAVLGKK